MRLSVKLVFITYDLYIRLKVKKKVSPEYIVLESVYVKSLN